MSQVDLVVLHAAIHTLDAQAPRAEALACSAGRIVALGGNEAVRALAGAQTKVLDAGGRMLMPGLVDGHCHPTKGAVAELFSARFAFDATPDDIAAVLRSQMAAHPAAVVIVGGRWGSGFFARHAIGEPRAWLDALSPHRAVYLRDDSGHNGWANSRALALAGIDDETPDPPGGRFGRAASGRLDGLTFETADSIVRNRLPDWSAAQYAAGLRAMAARANACGLTGVIDADAHEPLLAAYHAADRAGELPLAVVAAISTPFGHRETPLDCEAIEALSTRYASTHVDTRTVKIYLDGVPTGARTAAMIEPYLPHPDHSADERGHLHVEEAVLIEDLIALEQRGFTVKLHTAGDRAVHVALNAIERAHAASGSTALRHELAHAGFIQPADLPRFRALNVVADLSPYLWYPSPMIDAVRGAVGDRVDGYWPVRTLYESGAPLLAGSDWPAAAASIDPWPGLATLVTRRNPRDMAADALGADEALSLTQALDVFTRGGARALRRDAGRLAVGACADFILLDRDLFAVPPEEIAATRVLLTVFDGRIVHRDAAL